MVASTTDYEIYLDGLKKPTTKGITAGGVGWAIAGANSITISVDYNPCFQGIMDEVNMWNYALTADEIKNGYLNLSCGDGNCAGAENYTNCPQDCPRNICNNNIIEPGEVCDGTKLSPYTSDCSSYPGYTGGTLTCLANCSGYNFSGCYKCGDGIVQATEDCDGTNLPKQTCVALDSSLYESGALSCNADCSYNLSRCVEITPQPNATWIRTYYITSSKFTSGTYQLLDKMERMKFKVLDEYYFIGVVGINETREEVTINVSSDPENGEEMDEQLVLEINDTEEFDFDDNTEEDTFLKLNDIGSANFTIKRIALAICTPNWDCTGWSSCINNQQTQICTDLNNCGVLTGKPAETQSCIVCTPDWQCTDWEPEKCPSSKQQTRICTDSNACGTTTGKPAETQSCTYKPSSVWWWILIIILILAILAVIGIIVFIAIKKKKEAAGKKQYDNIQEASYTFLSYAYSAPCSKASYASISY